MSWRVRTSPSALTEGFFGQIVCWVFEILPKFHEKQIFPQWQITSRNYGIPPDYTVIPGAFDLNYETQRAEIKDVNLMDLRKHYAVILGNQWQDLRKLWTEYFRIPLRTLKRGINWAT